jgi:hypothetical protein
MQIGGGRHFGESNPRIHMSDDLRKHRTRRNNRCWLAEPTNKSLREAYLWMLLGGCLGVIEPLNWIPAIFCPVMRTLSHPVLSVGLIVAVLAVVCWRVAFGVKTDSTQTTSDAAK